MYKYLKSYITSIDELIASNKKINQQVIEKHLIKIQFFQHERQIHLYVTLAYAIFFLGSIFFLLIHPVFALIPLFMICFLIPYIVHYFHLENGVQYLYRQYDQLIERVK